MRRDPWLELLRRTLDTLEQWEDGWPEISGPVPGPEAERALADLGARLADCFPFFHSHYAGQMLKPPHPLAWVAYAIASAQNPNNHARDGGPATARMEVEVVSELAAMVGYDDHLGHLTSGGTIANLEALWVARELHPGKAVAVSREAHYTHARVAGLLSMPVVFIDCDACGRMDVNALERALAAAGPQIGTVVATLGTTGLGALDPLGEIAQVARQHRVRVHVDAAYGGFFALLARREPPLVAPEPFAAMASADSIVIDPHKHGLQPYGCGCILYRDPSVAAIYGHESPYTYYSDSERHLGEISLECSRPGAAAAALWTTLQAIPLTPEGGLGERLAAGRRAARAWAAAIEACDELELLTPPDTDILVFAPKRDRASAITAEVERIWSAGMADPQRPLYLAKLRVPAAAIASRWGVVADTDDVTLLRAVLMKPEHELAWSALQARVVELARASRV